MDQKLKYQIDKLVKTAVTGSLSKWASRLKGGVIMKPQILPTLPLSDESDPLRFKPHPSNMISKVRFVSS